jgi:hypothetical protein
MKENVDLIRTIAWQGGKSQSMYSSKEPASNRKITQENRVHVKLLCNRSTAPLFSAFLATITDDNAHTYIHLRIMECSWHCHNSL